MSEFIPFVLTFVVSHNRKKPVIQYVSKRWKSAALKFCDVTLGYDRHPAVHHLDGTIEAGITLGDTSHPKLPGTPAGLSWESN